MKAEKNLLDAQKILVIPDIHGRTFWEEPVKQYLHQVDRVVFLGDYLDPYPNEGKEYLPEDVFSNMMKIIDLKHAHDDKVILLKGNHDQHYSSEKFCELAGGTRMDEQNWDKYHKLFNENGDLFKIAHFEIINDLPYIFSHAGLTPYWLNKVNTEIWRMCDNKISITDPAIIEKINMLDTDDQGQEMLSVIGSYRTWFGEKTGSVLWADIMEHPIPDAPNVYGLNKVFQVFGHTRLEREKADMVELENLAMIDSQQCFMIDADVKKRILTLKEYESL